MRNIRFLFMTFANYINIQNSGFPNLVYNRACIRCLPLVAVVAAMALPAGAQQPAPAPGLAPAPAPAPAQQLDPQLDPLLTSRTIYSSGRVSATAAHPWAGFWKLSCKDEFGLAFIAAKPGLYSVLFCGPFACTKPGTFLPDTALLQDADYRLDNLNQIGVLDKNKRYNAHTRCVASP